MPKTNDSIESCHRSFEYQIGAHYLSLWKFISAIQGDEATNEAKREQIVNGESVFRIINKYKLLRFKNKAIRVRDQCKYQ